MWITRSNMKCITILVLCFGLFIKNYAETIPTQNPFDLHLTRNYSQDLSVDDYREIQMALKCTDVTSLLRKLYANDRPFQFTTYEDITGRCTKGLHQILLDETKGLVPKKNLLKIGKGGNRCVVCCVPFNGKYPQYLQNMKKALRKTGFNGHFLYYLGGFPNPTGKEILYAGVPYSFKIFAMIEAQKQGFKNVLWLDSALLPLKNIKPLFDRIEKNGAFLDERPSPGREFYIFTSTRKLLFEKTGVDVCASPHLVTTVFGLKMGTLQTKELIKQYYDFVKMGTPFLSCFPEEFVLSSIIHQPLFAAWHKSPILHLFSEGRKDHPDTVEEQEFVKSLGMYFYHQRGR